MAFFQFTSGAFDMLQLDLNAVFQGAGLAVSAAATTQVTQGVVVTVGTTDHSFPGQAITPDSHVRLDVASVQTFDLWGDGLTAAADGTFSAGTLNRLSGAANPGQPGFNVTGFAVGAAGFSAAAATVSSLDDLALFRQIFDGSDFVQGCGGDDVFLLGRGNDIYVDGGGQDRVFGGAGRDFVTAGAPGGGSFADTVQGGTGGDILVNLSGNGTLMGQSGNDMLIAGSQDDGLWGGAGQDAFVLGADSGHHRVMDFNPDQDVLVTPDAVTWFGDLHIVQRGANTRISFEGWSVVLKNVNVAALDFNVFGGATSIIETAQNANLAGFDYDV